MSNFKWVSLLGVAVLCSCSSRGVPVAAPITGNAVVILVPKDAAGAEDQLKGVELTTVDQVTEQKSSIVTFTNNSIKDFYSVTTTVPTAGQLVTAACKGEQYSDGKRDKSCVTYEARLVVEEKPEAYQLTITPVKMTTQQARNAIGVALDLPKFELSDWYQHILDEKVRSHYRVTSKFAPEAVKASFDRHFKRVADTEGEINAALKQFKTNYDYATKDGITAHLTAAISPDQAGSMVECEILLTAQAPNGAALLDWASALAAVRQELDRAGAE